MVIPIVFFLFILFSTETVIDTNEMKVKNNISSNELAKIPKNNLLKFRKVGIVSLNNDLNDKNYKLKTDTRKNNFPWIEQKLNYQKKGDNQQTNKEKLLKNKKVNPKRIKSNKSLPMTENDKKIMGRNYLKNLKPKNEKTNINFIQAENKKDKQTNHEKILTKDKPVGDWVFKLDK
jgi:hypothetical protein